ncbi:MAG: shikimate dehydrogenase [Alphaproteobacteria bacterium]
MSAARPRAGITGWPVSHSRSPILHGYWLRKYAIAGTYERIPIAPENFAPEFRALAGKGFAGANVTIPHKQAAMSLCDELDPIARRLRAVNTVVIKDGRFYGSNTDGFGFMENLRVNAPGWNPESGAAVIIGAGGAARAVIAALCDAGVKKIHLFNRTRARAEQVAAELGGPIVTGDWTGLETALADCGLLVNCSSLGMRGQPELLLSLQHLAPAALVCDLVYTPLQTPLLAAAAGRGNPTVDGLGMLLHQARPGFAAWFGRMPDVDETLRNLLLADIENAKG